MWTDATRVHHARAGLALPSDLTDGEWAVLKPFLPPPSFVGRPRKWPMRRIVEAILYLLRGGLPWRMLPPCFPPVSTVRRWFYLWRDNGLWRDLNHYLLTASRESEGREASPSAGVIDRASKPRKAAVRAATTQARRSRAASGISSPTPRAIWSMP
jgi:transposase